MTGVGASAPGKVVLCGEYAVLDGAPAIGMAVNRRAVATAAAAAGDCHVLVAPGLATGRWRFRAPAGRIEWLDTPPAGSGLFERLWSRLPPASAHWVLTLDTSALVDAGSGQKLGLGGSAAVAAATGAVLARLAGDDAAASRHAADAHREFQGGRGSGIDVATSLSGGVVEFRMARALEPRRLAWPAGLHCRFLWSGASASTVDRLERWRAGREPAAADGGTAPLTRCAQAVLDRWRDGDGDAVLESLGRYTRALRRFDDARRLGIFDAGHAALAAAATPPGLVYKPCGAGGGDVGVVFAADAAAAAEFERRAAGAGFTPLDLSADDTGVTYRNTPAA